MLMTTVMPMRAKRICPSPPHQHGRGPALYGWSCANLEGMESFAIVSLHFQNPRGDIHKCTEDLSKEDEEEALVSRPSGLCTVFPSRDSGRRRPSFVNDIDNRWPSQFMKVVGRDERHCIGGLGASRSGHRDAQTWLVRPYFTQSPCSLVDLLVGISVA